MRVLHLALAALLTGVSSVTAGEVPEAFLQLDVELEPRPGYHPEAAPPRFVLMEDGTVFVGGSSAVMAGKLERNEVKALEKRLELVRKTRGLGPNVQFGAGSGRYRLRMKKGPDLAATGDPATAPALLRPLASLVEDLARFGHPSLRPFTPGTYFLLAREGRLSGGCRRWDRPDTLVEASAGKVVPAEGAARWPTGARAALVCGPNGKTYEVTHRPLLPGERP